MLEDLKKITELSFIKDKNIFYEAVFKKEDILNIFKELKDNELFSFDQLIDITAIDYPSKENRFELIYIFLSMIKNKRIVLKTSIKSFSSISTISSSWPINEFLILLESSELIDFSMFLSFSKIILSF